MQFEDFLRERLAGGGFTTEDALAGFLPLMRQAVEAHAEGKLAPLEGLSALRVDGARIWFEESQLRPPRSSRNRVRRLERAGRASFEVVQEARVVTDVGEGHGEVANLHIGRRDDEITRPVYLPGYVCWEHLVDHHDPITDVFSLGLILASLACGLDLSDEDDLNAFVAHRRNLFALCPNLHPVLARVIVRMTELERSRRPQDLASLLRVLENYRDQEVDFELELARDGRFGTKDRKGKQQVILSKLQERLFEISRRNRLLHFRPTMQTVNLTHASVPLSFDARTIRPDQILTWNEKLHKELSAGRPISLNRFLNFREAAYLPSVLDRIRIEANRDQHEYGFAQLRLVACFLRWANLKASPPEEYESPLVLIPVELTKKKGVRDTYWLRPLESAAEINPVVRHLFKQLYDIELPETIDLEQTSLDELHRRLVREIESSEPAVSLNKIDRPRIDLIHEKARRRLDQYRRQARLAGRGVRHFLDLDYSYDPANYHPLGLKLFSSRIRPAQTRLQAITDSKPRPRHYAVAPPAKPAGEPVVEKEQSSYHLREHGDGNPYTWEFDLCSVTLGNFKYRKMSLVRDYTALGQDNPPNPAFDATFSLTPRPVDRDGPQTLPLDERFHVVPCDPTQTAAIAEARTGRSYIIQGPPGTGKSQTITNLIADYVARGLRVLFVCEKRAAIDVVYHRLRQKGLDRLCCLIHDSQADKKEFVMDLKRTYELFLAESDGGDDCPERRRMQLLKSIAQELEPLEGFDAAMKAAPPAAGVPVRSLLHRLIELTGELPDVPPRARERVPRFVACHASRDGLHRFREALEAIQSDGVLARQPLRLLATSLRDIDRPIELVGDRLQTAARLLNAVLAPLRQTALPEELWGSMERVEQLVRYAVATEFLARRNLMALLNGQSALAREFRKQASDMADLEVTLRERQQAAGGWKQTLLPREFAIALGQARDFERDPLRFFKPAWWRLRSALKRCYDFRSHQIRPGWVQILEWLDEEHRAAAAYREAESRVCQAYGIGTDLSDFLSRMERLAKTLVSLPESVGTAHEQLLQTGDADRCVVALAGARADLDALQGCLEDFLDEYQALSLEELSQALTEIDDALDELPDYLDCLRELANLPREIAAALRSMPWTLDELEAAAARRSFDEILRADRSTAKFNGTVRSRHIDRLERLTRDWQEVNARLICERVRRRFREHVTLSTLPAAQLMQEQKAFKKQYSRGRRELEHEFGKTMRYKPIRDLVAGESGMVVKDLKPVWLMSPLSVSDTLPLDTDHFDVVIFDEASQIPLEEAVPPLFRAIQTIVVGDEMQLPPTNFFSARRPEEDERVDFEEDGDLVHYDLESDSFLNHAARNLPARMLGWHYRSRSESLISFSNWAFYRGRLLTVPEERLIRPGRAELKARCAEDAARNAAELLSRPVSFHFMEHGLYQKRRNPAEAEYIAGLVQGLLACESRPTIGIVAFSEAQQDEIERAVDRLADEDRGFRERLEAELDREEDGQFVGLLVKNLENIQGDERDVIIMSVCYGHGPDGRMRMNFGPINQSGGEKRLNVAFSRAKHHMALVSSIRAGDITNDYNDGANCLKNYLQYAEACSTGEMEAAHRVLRSMSLARNPDERPHSREDAVVDRLAAALRERGYLVDRGVGQSHFRCDLAVRRDGDEQYRLGILVDTDEYYRQSDILERDLMKPKLLRAFGWRVAVVLTKDWWERRDDVLQSLEYSIDGGEPELTDDDRTIDAMPLDTDAAIGGDSVIGGDGADNGSVSSNSQRGFDVAGSSRYFEFIGGTSARFWEITVSGPEQAVRFGRVGSNGQTRTRLFDDGETAVRDALRQISRKLAKGYEERSGSRG